MSQLDQYCDGVIPGKVEVSKFFETDETLAYYARKPEWPVHIIVIPKIHINSIVDIEKLEDIRAAILIKDLARVIGKFQDIYGKCRIRTNAGEYQHTKHLHWHLYTED